MLQLAIGAEAGNENDHEDAYHYGDEHQRSKRVTFLELFESFEHKIQLKCKNTKIFVILPRFKSNEKSKLKLSTK